MSEVIQWNDPSYVVITEGDPDVYGQFQVAFPSGPSAPASESEKDAYAEQWADFVKSLWPTASVRILKQYQGAKTDSNFYTSGS